MAAGEALSATGAGMLQPDSIRVAAAAGWAGLAACMWAAAMAISSRALPGSSGLPCTRWSQNRDSAGASSCASNRHRRWRGSAATWNRRWLGIAAGHSLQGKSRGEQGSMGGFVSPSDT